VKAKAALISFFVLSFIVAASAIVKQGEKAPDFTLPDLDGNNATLSKITGKGPVYINFWATWCGPCKREIPELVKLYAEYEDRGFKVLAISIDDSRTQGKVKSFVKNYSMDFPILLDSNGDVFRRKYKARAVPYGFLIDNDGNVIHVARGYMPGMEKTLVEKMTPFLISAEDKDASESQEPENPASEDTSEKNIAKPEADPDKQEAKK
jgi:peroxiredoxin